MEKEFSISALLPTPNALWDFASQVYRAQEVETLALQLQDEYQANINIMLWCAWLKAENIQVSVNLLDKVLTTIDALSIQTVNKLREVRRVLEASGGFTKVQALSIKKHILNAELMIEKVLLHRLQDLTCRFLESCESRAMCEHDRAVDLQYYLQFINVPDARKHAALFLNACERRAAREAV